MCTSSRGWVATVLSMGTFYSFAFEDDALAAFLNMLLCLYSHLGPEEMVVHEVEHSFEAQMANPIMASF